MDTRSRLSLAPYLHSRTGLKDLNSDRKNIKATSIMKTISNAQKKLSKENKQNIHEAAKSVTTSKFRCVPSRTDSNFIRRKTLDPNFKKSLPKEKPVADQIIYKSPKHPKKEVPLQKELKTLLVSTNLGTPNTVKIPSILQGTYENEENVKKVKRRSVKFASSENSSKPYSHNQSKCLDEKRERMNEWLRKRGKAPVTNRHSLCFCKQASDHDGPRCKRTLTKEEIMMQKKKLDDEKHKVAECDQENLENCEVKKDENLFPKMEMPKETLQELNESEQMDPVIKECSILLDAGCPSSNILNWLKEIQERLPTVMNSAEFWLLKARVHAIDKDMDSLLEVFSNAMKHGATPINTIADSMPQMIKDVMSSSNETKKDEICTMEEMPVSENELADLDEMSDDVSLYSPSQSPAFMDSIFDYDVDDIEYKTPVPPVTPGIMRLPGSSSIKYSVKKTTPFKKRGNNHDESAVIVTPVRRSNRKSLGRKSLVENVISSLDELSFSDKQNLLLKSNAALENFN